jgi:transposase InsO family protein
MTYRRDYFWNYKYVQLKPIYLADDTTHIPQGRGSVKFFLLGIFEKWISNVWYVPSFKKKLLSLVTIRQDGHKIVMEDGLVKIMSVKDNLKTIMSGYEDGKLLRMNGKVIKRKEEVATTSNSKMSSFRLWHFRFGHLNFESLLKLKSQDLVKGLPTFKKENSKCESCILGKKKRESFPTSSWQATKYLELIHSDICGPMEYSFGGCRYFVLFIDDHTRMTWVYFLKSNSEAFEKFLNFQHVVENETREKVASLRTNIGAEFTSTEFNDYCQNNGIKWQLTNSYTPQQNGVTERMNRTLMGMARSMMQFKGLSTKYWVEAVHNPVYLRN